jgi:3-oxoacyl-[acyl-carrier-protein] synthase III
VGSIYLSSIGHSHGELRPVAELGESGAHLAPLIEEVVNYRASDHDVWELAAQAAEHTLSRSAARPDLMIYVTETDPVPSRSLPRIVDQLGLGTVDHLAMSGHDCGNLGPVLQVAGDVLGSGRRARILLVLADCARPGCRVMPSSLSVFSDGAVSCLATLDRPADGPFVSVDAIATRTEVTSGGTGAAEESILSTVRLAADSVAEALRADGSRPEDFEHVLFANYRSAVQQFLVSAMKIPKHKLLTGLVSEYGHCFSADVLVSLERFLADGTLAPGDRVLAATIGPCSWSTMAVTCTTAELGAPACD